MKIAVYATDHGYGHLSRQLGWIERCRWEKEDQIYIVNKSATKIIDGSQNLNLINIPRSTDMGPLFDNETFQVDIEKTRKELDRWNKIIDTQIRTESEFIEHNGIDLVISDISPIPLAASKLTSIPSLAISSFSWHWVYDNLIPDHPINERLHEMYQTATETFILPLTEEMSIFPNRTEIPLISRIPDGQVNIDSNRRKIFVSMGYTVFPDLSRIFRNNDCDFIVPEHLSGKRNTISIPSDEENITSYLKSADMAILKTGYSSIAEAISLRKPMIAVKRRMIEDEHTGRTVEDLGIGISIYIEELEGIDLKDYDIDHFKNNYEKLPEIYENKGWKYVEDWIRRRGE